MTDGWQSTASLPKLEAGEIQLWRIDLTEAVASSEIYRKHLSPEELDRAERLRAGQVRLQFVVARACLRVLLGNFLRLTPDAVSITLSAYGKPETPPVNGRLLFFNVAHSRETVLIALCREGRVGVDLEYFDRATDTLEVARAFFTKEEGRQIEEIADPAQRQRAFFQCWTRKEAVIKADGRGLSLPLTSFEVRVRDSAESMPVAVDEPTSKSEASAPSATWNVSDLALGGEIAGAIAVEFSQLRLRTFQFPLSVIDAADSKA